MGKRLDLVGQRFGRLTVIKEYGKDKHGKVLWLCKCDCGNEVITRSDKLRGGGIKSCGCYKKDSIKKRVKDLTGMKFGRLIVVKEYGRDKGGKVQWLCKCECGNEVVVRGSNLTNNCTTSCGCYQKDKAKKQMEEQWKDEDMKWKMGYKGGITPISDYLRHLLVVSQWRKDTYIKENNKCQLTGKKVHGGNSDVHHLYGFNMIVLEAHELHNIQIKPQVKDYTEEELHKLEEYIASWLKDTSNAVLLSKEVHDLFHSLYGYGDNTPEQYEEFRERYMAGEFKDVL